ncbi:hypothetical protein I6F40_03795 [Pseudoalteromonas sp. SWXJ133]|uniref:asparagine synthase-related protein n=1 Tax=Pseudoalteromonas sp. SWXJ133 TaxID=2792069 RepID=UPI0018CE543F|nr:asparagine synthase-related protein [Pseudoalteromonas sp. SWXJ133]MBH0019495.1 hypothetical protein [Pseudoalteromonas sp. SWXJ133]
MTNNYWENLTGIDQYIIKNAPLSPFLDIKHALKSKVSNKIDPAAVLSVLMKNYSIGDRTLVSGINKLPWMSKVEYGSIVNASLPTHGEVNLSEDDVSDKLIELMKLEALNFLANKTSVGILLSGGMDSRIIAAVIKKLQDEGLYTGTVTALTWGIDNCRDVVYAKRIADTYNWDFNHFIITPETLLENIKIAGVRGAEYSPVHLHAMPSIANFAGLDGVLAGSYGDSIGRGEYSGRKVGQLPSLLSKHLNEHSFLLKSVENKYINVLHKDILDSRNRFPGRSETAYREIEMQMHYMRRQLNSCMSIIDENIPLYQMFTAPDVFGFIWSLSPKCRTDGIYELMLKKLSSNMLDIPWARDGKIYNKANSSALDTLNKSYHRYGDWLRNDNREFVVEQITNGNLASLNIFNEKALKFWCKNWRDDNRARADRLDEKMAWLASLSIFVGKYDIKGLAVKTDNSILDSARLLKARVHESLYYTATKLKK